MFVNPTTNWLHREMKDEEPRDKKKKNLLWFTLKAALASGWIRFPQHRGSSTKSENTAGTFSRWASLPDAKSVWCRVSPADTRRAATHRRYLSSPEEGEENIHQAKFLGPN